MAILKWNGYDNDSIRIITGDEDFDRENEADLTVTPREVIKAINKLGCLDQLVGLVLKVRKEKHDALLRKVGAVE